MFALATLRVLRAYACTMKHVTQHHSPQVTTAAVKWSLERYHCQCLAAWGVRATEILTVNLQMPAGSAQCG
jgi:hypothetical protein